MPEGGFYVRDMRRVQTTVRHAIGSAARQLKPLAGKHIPLVIVLANPAAASVRLELTVYAMYGDMQARLSRNAEGATTTTWQAHLNGQLGRYHSYTSGVLVLRQGSRRADALRNWQPSRKNLTSDEFSAELNAYVETIGVDGLDTYLETIYIEAPGTTATPLPEGAFVGRDACRWRLTDDGTITRGPA